MPNALLERPPAARPTPPAGAARRPSPTPTAGGASRPPRRPGGGGGGGRGPRGDSDQWSIWLATLVTALIGALFTFLGILTQIWANIAGTQLPGA